MPKISFLMYLSFEEIFKNLSPEEVKVMILAIYSYQRTGKNPDFGENRTMTMLWLIIKHQFDIDSQKYVEVCERNRINGSRGGRPPKKQAATTETQETQSNRENPVGYLETDRNRPQPTATGKTQSNPKNLDIDIDKEKKILSCESIKEKTTRFSSSDNDGYPTTVDEIMEIASRPEVGARISREEAERYVEYRNSTNWYNANGIKIELNRVGWDLKVWTGRAEERRNSGNGSSGSSGNSGKDYDRMELAANQQTQEMTDEIKRITGF